MFTRKKITIPSAGESNNFFLEGNSMIIESVPVYSSPEQVPLLAFGDSSNTPQPIYPQSTYRSDAGFNRFAIIGTDESAGDTLYVLASDQCLEEEINIFVGGSKRATLKASFSITMTDSVQQLSELQIIDDDGNLPSAMYITPTGGGARYAFDADPNQTVSGGLAHVVQENEVQKIEGINFIKAFRFISDVSAGAGKLTITLEY